MSILPSNWDQLFAQDNLAFRQVTTNVGQDYSAQVWGQVIPLSQGERAAVGAPIWADDTQATYSYSDSPVLSFYGSDGDGVTSGQGHELITTVSYKRSFAHSFGFNLAPEGEHTQPVLQRLWINKVLVYDVRNPGLTTKEFGLVDFTFYPGSSTQLPDATMVAKDGALVPGYRGLIYIVIRNLNLGSSTTAPGAALYGSTATPVFDFSKVAQIPEVRAELVDGAVTTVSAQQYTLTDTTNLPLTQHALPNHTSRKWLMVDNGTGSPLYQNRLMTFDIDGAVELSSTRVTGTVNGHPIDSSFNFGLLGQGYFNAWDTKNDVYYGELGSIPNNNTIVSVDRKTGVVKGWCGVISTFGPIDSLGGDPAVSKLDAVAFPFWHDGDVSWYRNGDGVNKPVIAGGELFNGYLTVIAPQPDGTMGNTVPYDAIMTFGSLTSVGFYHIADLMPNNSVQDPIAIVCHGTKATAVFIHVDGNYRAHIVGTQDIADFAPKHCVSFAVDGSGAINFMLDDGSTNRWMSRYSTKVASNSNQFWSGSGSVAGFSGSVPVWTKVYDPVSMPGTWGGDIQQFRRTDWSKSSQGAFMSGGDITTLDLSTAQSSTISQGVSLTGKFWDPVGQQMVGPSNAGGGSAYNIPIATNTNFVANPISNYLKWFAVRAGYLETDLTIDSQLTDVVLGSLVVQDFEFFTLMNSLGQLYDFTFFPSSGKLKFVKIARNPVKASAVLLYNPGNVSAGDTVQVGSQIYTYRAVPTLPFEVLFGATLTASRDNMVAAINLSGIMGTTYGTGTTVNTSATASPVSTDQLRATAIHGGTAGNSIVANRGGNMAWIPFGGGGFLSGGLDSAAPDLNLTRDNMCAIAEGQAGVNEVLITTLNEPAGGVGSAVMSYWDFNQDYASNTAQFTGDTQTSGSIAAGELRLAIPFVYTEAEANSRIQKLGLQGPQKSITQEMRLPLQFLLTEPVDVASVTIPPYNYLIKLDEVTINADWTLSCTGLNFASRDDIVIPDMVNRQTDTTVKTTGDSIPVVFDMPFAQPTSVDVTGKFALFDAVRSYGQSGFTVAAVSTQVSGASQLVFTATAALPYGFVPAVLPATNTPWIVDENPITLALKTARSTDFASASVANFLAGKNLLVVGAPGRWELIYFRDVTVISSTVVQLTGVVRGMRGTEVNCNNHQATDQFYLVASVANGFQVSGFQEYRANSDIGSTVTYTSQGAPAAKPVGTTSATFAGYSWYPFAPVCVHATKSGPDVVLTWKRRDRHSTSLWVEQDEAMSETSELYKIEIMSGSSVVRTVTGLTTPTFTYTSAMQTADGFTPTITSIKLRVYQVGTLGPGFTKEQTLDVE